MGVLEIGEDVKDIKPKGRRKMSLILRLVLEEFQNEDTGLIYKSLCPVAHSLRLSGNISDDEHTAFMMYLADHKPFWFSIWASFSEFTTPSTAFMWSPGRRKVRERYLKRAILRELKREYEHTYSNSEKQMSWKMYKAQHNLL